MTITRTVSRLALLVLLTAALAGRMPPAAAQATPDVYESSMGDVRIEIAAPWAFDGATSVTGNDFEIVGLRGADDQLLISFLPGTAGFDDAETGTLGALEEPLDAYQQIDGGSYDDVTYALGMARQGSVEVGVFSVYTEPNADDIVEFVTYLGPAAGFADGLDVLQQSVTVDGVPVLDGVEGDGLQELLDAHAGITGDVTESGTPDDLASTPEAAAETDSVEGERDARKLPPPSETPEATNESETGRGAGADRSRIDSDDLEALGLVEEGEYVSPQLGTEVLWDETWELYLDAEEPISSDTAEGMDSVVLTWTGESFVLFYVDLFAAEGLTPADFTAFWASDEYLDENADPDAEILLDDSDPASGAVLLRDYLSDGEEVLILREAISLDRGDTIALMTLIGLPDSFADAYADAEEGITIDGEPAVLTFTVRQIERAQ